MNKILFVSIVDPFAFGGGSQATLAYFDALLELFGRNNLILMLPNESVVPSSYDDIAMVKIAARSKWRSLPSFIKGVLGRFAETTTKYVKTHKGELKAIFFNGGNEAGWCFKELRKEKIVKIAIHHNQQVEFCMDNKTFSTLGGRWAYPVRKQERNAYRYSDVNLFLTQEDMNAFERDYGMPSGKNALIGTYDYKNREIETVIQTSKLYDISISGSLVTYQTTVGVLDFHKRYLAIAKKYIPNLKILLTGRSPSEPIKALQNNNPDIYTIIPNPQRILPIVQQGKIFLCPTCIGGGLKLRAMDGLKSGMPVLVHEISARGYDYYFNKPYFKVYNNEDSFEQGLRDLLQFIDSTPNYAEIINQDYYDYFGYKKGVERMKKALGDMTLVSIKKS